MTAGLRTGRGPPYSGKACRSTRVGIKVDSRHALRQGAGHAVLAGVAEHDHAQPVVGETLQAGREAGSGAAVADVPAALKLLQPPAKAIRVGLAAVKAYWRPHLLAAG